MEKCNNLNNPIYKISKQGPQVTSRRRTNLTASTVRIKKAPRSRSRSPTRSSSLSRRSSSPTRSSTLSARSRTSRRSSSPASSSTLSTRSRTSRRSSSPASSSTLSTRSRTSRRSSLSVRSNASSVRSRSTSRSSAPAPRKNSLVRSESSAPTPTRNEKSAQNLSPNMSLLPEEEETELSYDDSKDNNFEILFKNQIFALNAIVENLNKDISTHKEILKTAKQMNSEVKDLNKNINKLTDSINNELTEDRVHNKKVELLYLKKQLLTIQLAASYKTGT